MFSRRDPRSSIRRAVVVGLVVAAAATSAWAFRPSSTWLLDQAVNRQLRRQIATLNVVQELERYDIPSAPKGLTVPGRTRIVAPDMVRIEWGEGADADVTVRTEKGTLTRRPGAPEAVGKTFPSPLWDFLTIGAPLQRRDAAERLKAALQAIKVDIDIVSYARFDGHVNFLIGSKAFETDKPQVWLNKDTLLVTRVVSMKKVGDAVVRADLRLLGWGSPVGGNWFPKTIEYYEGETLKWRAHTRDVERNEHIDRALFDLPK